MGQPTRTILLDADIVAYQHASTGETRVDWGDGDVQQYTVSPKVIEDRIDTGIALTVKKLRADEVIVCLTDDTNFRHAILPSYKMNRKGLLKPLHLVYAKEYMERNYRTYKKPGLEADDVMGILATHPKIIKGKKVIVSIDKDMRQIPGWLFNPDKHTKPILVTEAMGDHYHLHQTLTGDPVDGYKGCPKVGKVTATNVLEPFLIVDHAYAFDGAGAWKAVVKTYEEKGLTEDDALVQAQVARICQWQDYDYTNNEVIPWRPKV